jgi:polysaccharide biosynthesis protein PslJ
VSAGDWPRTGRVLPWMLALFLGTVWLVPSEAIELPIALPIDAHPDRFLLLALAAAACVSVLTGRAYAPSTPAVGMSLALLGFVAMALISLAANSDTLVSLGELDQGRKQVAVLLSMLALFFVVATVIRRSELRNFGILIVGLGAIAAVGCIWEYRTDYNVFYDLADRLFGSVATVSPPPAPTLDSRDETFGPTQHGLAIVTMFTLALPLAVLGLISARIRWQKVLYGLAAGLMFAGAICTQRKTSIIAPAASMMVLLALRPRQMMRLAPLGVVMVLAVHVLAPAALGGVISQLTGGFFDSGSTIGRTSDYEAIAPDIATYPLTGRGYGTIDPTRSDTYRLLDNHYLGTLLQTGFIGLGVYLALLVTAMALAYRVFRHGPDPDARRLGLAALAGFFAFTVAGALFDLFSFLQVPYLFCILAGFCSVAAAGASPAGAPQPAREPTPHLREVPAL